MGYIATYPREHTPMLTDKEIKNAQIKEKSYKLYDSEGLYLHVLCSGGKVWRYKYKFNGKEKLLTIGKYRPTGNNKNAKNGYTLKEAREERAKAYALVTQGICPASAKKQQKEKQKIKEMEKPTGKTFKEVAYKWAEFKSMPKTERNWTQAHKRAVLNSLEREALPLLGDKIIHTVTQADIDAVIEPIEERGAIEVLGRTINRLQNIFDYGIHKGWCEINPATGKHKFLPKRKAQSMNFVTEKDLPLFLRDLDNYQGNIVCKLAVQFVLLTHVRTKELRFAEWKEIDFESKQWHIPAQRIKMKISQTIPLSRQAIDILKALKPITGKSNYIFASLQAMSKPISENGMLSVIYNMGWKNKTTIHGVARSTFSTIANETLKMRPDVIEASLAHQIKDPVRAAYNHATYLEERTQDAQIWADYLDRLRVGADVVDIAIKKIG